MTSNETTHSGSNSDNPISRVLNAVPPDTAVTLSRLINEHLREISDLRIMVRTYLQELIELNEEYEFLDLKLAKRLAARCEALLDGLGPESPTEAQQLIQAAVLYFVEGDDAEDDVQSPIGFDDDAEVIELVAREIGRQDVLDLDT